MSAKPTLLIVDDEERNIRLLKAMLKAQDYYIQEAPGGEQALCLALEEIPDMILLDVMMPGMDGFEVCRRLKGDEKTRAVPVILVTALSEKKHRVQGMEAGADDFISKPVDQTELVVRVRSLLRIKSYQDDMRKSLEEIAAQNARLEELEKIRDGLAHMIVHDMRSPLTGIHAYLELALADAQGLSESQKEGLGRALFLSEELERMVQNLLDIGKMEAGKLELTREMTPLGDSIREVLQRFAVTAEMKKIDLLSLTKGNLPPAAVDRSILKRVLSNLLDNAIRYSPSGTTVSIGVDFVAEERALCISVRDNGRGLPPEYHKRIFDKFEQVKLKKEKKELAGSSGLGLTFCKMAVEAHGGRIWVESEGLEKGCTFKALFPLSPQNSPA